MSPTTSQAIRAEDAEDALLSESAEGRILGILRSYYGPILEEKPPQHLVDLVLGDDADVNHEDSQTPQPA